MTSSQSVSYRRRATLPIILSSLCLQAAYGPFPAPSAAAHFPAGAHCSAADPAAADPAAAAPATAPGTTGKWHARHQSNEGAAGDNILAGNRTATTLPPSSPPLPPPPRSEASAQPYGQWQKPGAYAAGVQQLGPWWWQMPGAGDGFVPQWQWQLGRVAAVEEAEAVLPLSRGCQRQLPTHGPFPCSNLGLAQGRSHRGWRPWRRNLPWGTR